ncbi:hypothetical protein HS088_TW10G00216 [Tripterygium wilfordii]|uniref:Uncharacterized protein n=1 Tax=Tripterygium wilfordii TaxID=458696 RepID=A0A7J7D4F5_TRIWF|nr:hypothetical protein HS088_TW10G00216 [Tripterygium wilfordii]
MAPDPLISRTLERSGLVTAAASFVVAGSAAFLPNGILLSEIIRKNLDIFYLLGAGAARSYSSWHHVDARGAPVFKEGLCYGKLEAAVLTFIIPMVLLGHLTGLMDDGAKLNLLASWMALFVIFAGRKFTQPIKDDIGDKSVFMFNSLSKDQKKSQIEKLEQQKPS